MADLKGTPGGELHRRVQLYRDDGDGTMSEVETANMRIWNTSTLAWDKWDGTIKAGVLDIGIVDQGTGGSSPWAVGGSVASGSADSGNPVKVGAKYNLTIPTFTDGQRVDLQTDNRGGLFVGIKSFGGATVANVLAPSDGLTSQNALMVTSQVETYNETTWDRQRGNTTASLIATGTITTQTNKAITNYNARYLEIVLNITAASSTPTATVAISGTTASGYAFPILTGVAVVTTGTTVYRVGPGLTASTNAVANDLVPRNILVTVTITGSVTYGVDYVLSV